MVGLPLPAAALQTAATRLGRACSAQDQRCHLRSVGVLQEMPGCRDGIKARLHLLCPLPAPVLIEDIVSASPDKVNRLIPFEQSLIVMRLGWCVAIVMTVNGDG